jgi:hypothetical protein
MGGLGGQVRDELVQHDAAPHLGRVQRAQVAAEGQELERKAPLTSSERTSHGSRDIARAPAAALCQVVQRRAGVAGEHLTPERCAQLQAPHWDGVPTILTGTAVGSAGLATLTGSTGYWAAASTVSLVDPAASWTFFSALVGGPGHGPGRVLDDVLELVLDGVHGALGAAHDPTEAGL